MDTMTTYPIEQMKTYALAHIQAVETSPASGG